jgi:ankyrin repeat protein
MIHPQVISCILEGDMAMLGRYLAAGADPDYADHNANNLLHVAAAEGSLTAVSVLLVNR